MADCFSVTDACVFVVSRLDDDGTPVTGATASYQAGSLIEVTWEEVPLEIAAIEVPDACGNMCLLVPGCKSPKWFNVTVEFCKIDFRLEEILIGGDLLYAYGLPEDAVGFADPGLDKDCAARISLEVYEKAYDVSIPNSPPYLRHVFPMLPLFSRSGTASMKKGERTIKVESQSFANPNFGTGPQDDLDPSMPTTSPHAEYFSELLPEISCGYTSVSA